MRTLIVPSLLLLLAGCSADAPPQNDADDAGTPGPGGPVGAVPDAGPAQPQCTDACTVGQSRCSDAGVESCTIVDGCPSWSPAQACGSDQRCFQGACVPCAGLAGTFREQSFMSGGDQRRYLLHVPETYRCESEPWPVLVDFHGTGGGGTGEAAVEEYYGTEALIRLADKEKFLVIRPRSRWASWNGGRVYQWDINSGDLEKNTAFTRELLAFLKGQYHVDPRRVYASGFSNGTNMAVQFLADSPALFHGYGVHAGGVWTPPLRGAFGDDAPRIYATTGYRDYMFSTQQTLVSFLSSRAYPEASLWVREADTGHELYDWHFEETFAWLDRGERPHPGALAPGWTKESMPDTEASLLQLARAPAGELTASGTSGTFFRRVADGTWTQSGQVSRSASYSPAFTDLCFFPSGKGIAVGEGVVALTNDNGATWTRGTTIPEFGPPQFGYSYLTAVDCSGTRVTGGGYWTAVTSEDEGATFTAASMPGWAGTNAQIAAVRASATGRWVAVGYYNYVGTSDDGVQFSHRILPSDAAWFTDVESGSNGRWWAVGEGGAVITSKDDGVTWSEQAVPTTQDLYAVDFFDDQVGMAVGAHGTAVLTTNGGATWSLVPTGLDAFLGDVHWLDSQMAIAVGEGGMALRFSRSP